ncbi:hypothetical protein ADH76_01860 [Enterocloster clostridioformis]|nr:hypothetical protein A4V08_02550 [Lachnoclostridium sp. YL32]OXE70228.1 hypothetical protein ADH76_01860 [Enterocloster clostridioformis]
MDAIHRVADSGDLCPGGRQAENTEKGITAETDSVCRRNVLGCSQTGCILSLLKWWSYWLDFLKQIHDYGKQWPGVIAFSVQCRNVSDSAPWAAMVSQSRTNRGN